MNCDNLNTNKIGVFMWYDDKIKEYADINYKINKIYCEKYGYNIIKSNERLYPNRKPHWERFPLLLKYFDEYDYLIWIDADAHFYLDSPPITNIINEYPDKVIIISEDQNCKNKTCEVNSGIFIVKSCEEGREILNIWGYDKNLYNKMNGFLNWNDQAILYEMYRLNLLNIYEKSIIIKYGILQYFYESDKLPEKKFGLTNKPFIFHLASSKEHKRIKHSNNYLINHYNKFMNSNIQLTKTVISDILLCCQNKKLLVFGLGYDSELWYNATNKNTYFVENNQEYIDLNKNIDSNNIIYYEYKGITVESSLKSSDTSSHKLADPKQTRAPRPSAK
jgi:hypothetical protein